MGLKKVLFLAILGNVAAADVQCNSGTPCGADLVCQTDPTDRTGKGGTCIRPSQWVGDDCSAIIEMPNNGNGVFIDSCDATMNLVCVSGEVRTGYTCQKVESLQYGGCLSTAASFASQCGGDLVCAAYPGVRQMGTCQTAQGNSGGYCSALVITGPGYISDSCSNNMECREGACRNVTSTGGMCNELIYCPDGDACTGTCETQPAPMYCTDDRNCKTGEVCAMGQCMIAAGDNGLCDERSQLPWAQQLFCPSGEFCLLDPVVNLAQTSNTCQPDKCYGRCGAGTRCDNNLRACVEDQKCESDTQNPCCVPSKELDPQCSSVLQECVCAFDDTCCQTGGGVNHTGWDWSCVKNLELCGLTC